MTTQTMSKEYQLADIPIVQSLFTSKAMSWLWLAIRLYLGYQWIESGWGKITNPAWMQGGEALKGFWVRAILIPEAPARPLIAFDWYRNFIQFMLDSGNYVWFAKLVAVGELLVGAALILGIFIWLSAFIGGFMNWNFMMAGSASVAPIPRSRANPRITESEDFCGSVAPIDSPNGMRPSFSPSMKNARPISTESNPSEMTVASATGIRRTANWNRKR